MDGVALLYRARHAGLRLEATGDTLKITGPKRAEPVVRLIAEYKSKVLAVLTATENEPRYWHERLTARTFEWSNGTRSWNSAQRLALGGLRERVAQPLRRSLAGLAMCWLQETDQWSRGNNFTGRQSSRLRANRLPHRVRSSLAGRCSKGFNCARA